MSFHRHDNNRRWLLPFQFVILLIDYRLCIIFRWLTIIANHVSPLDWVVVRSYHVLIDPDQSIVIDTYQFSIQNNDNSINILHCIDTLYCVLIRWSTYPKYNRFIEWQELLWLYTMCHYIVYDSIYKYIYWMAGMLWLYTMWLYIVYKSIY